MKFRRRNEEAMSPVIGAVLLVAVTVILASVIATFLFGLPSDIPTSKIVGTTTTRYNSTWVFVLYNGGGKDALTLKDIYFTVNGANASIWVHSQLCDFTPFGGGTNNVMRGQYGKIPLPAGCYANVIAPVHPSHIVGVGEFLDGTSGVVVDTNS